MHHVVRYLLSPLFSTVHHFLQSNITSAAFGYHLLFVTSRGSFSPTARKSLPLSLTVRCLDYNVVTLYRLLRLVVVSCVLCLDFFVVSYSLLPSTLHYLLQFVSPGEHCFLFPLAFYSAIDSLIHFSICGFLLPPPCGLQSFTVCN